MISHRELCERGLNYLESLLENLYFLHSAENLHRGLVNFKSSVFALESSLSWLDESEESVETLISLYFTCLKQGVAFLTEAMLYGEDVENSYMSIVEFVKEQRTSALVPRYGSPEALYRLVS